MQSASLACHLADAGLSVALVEAARLPSSQRMSTHLIQPPGMDELDRLGVGSAVRDLSPVLRTVRLAFDGNEVQLPYSPGRAAHCLRRERLDDLLQVAAMNAGAALWTQSRVVDLIRSDDGRVRGVELRQNGAKPVNLRAELVVGADGRPDHVSAYLASVRSCALLRSHLGEALPASEVRGMLKTRYYFRACAGAGWALIGDAGHHKDLFAGLGITDALRDAHELSLALTATGPESLEEWWRHRDAERIEVFRWAQELGSPQPVDALKRLTAARLSSAPRLHTRFGQVMDGRLSPYDLVPAASAIRWTVGSMLAGDPRSLVQLLGVGHRRGRARRERRHRSRALSRVRRCGRVVATGFGDTRGEAPSASAVGRARGQ